MSENPTAAVNATDIRKRLRGQETPVAAADSSGAAALVETPAAKKGPVKPLRPKSASGLIPQPSRETLANRLGDPSKMTPLPAELALQAAAMEELVRVRAENVELRNLIETAILQEQEFNDRLQQAADRELELQNQIDDIQRHAAALAEQVNRLKEGAGDTGELIVRLQEREDDTRLLTEQVQQLEQQLAVAQSANGIDQYIQAIQERDQAIETLNLRIAELEQQIANIPPPPPTDEELAKMADDLERERCKVTQLRKDLDEEKKTHEEDVEDFERQMREMEVQLSKERADIARQRSELQRMQAEVRAELEAVHRGDGALRDRLAQIQRSVHEPNGNGRAPSGGPPANAAARKEKDSGLMQRLFGKK